MVTGETPPVMKNTGANDYGPGDSVWFVVQDGSSAAHPQTLVFLIFSIPALDEGQPESVLSTC